MSQPVTSEALKHIWGRIKLVAERRRKPKHDYFRMSKKACALVLAERDYLRKYEALYAQARETLCSCNIVDTSQPVGSDYNYICEWCEEHPEGAEAPYVIKQMWKLEEELAELRRSRTQEGKQ